MFIGTGLLVALLGFICLKHNELAWHIYEIDSRMWGIHVERPKNWRDRVYYASTTLIFMGAAAVALGLKMMLV